MPGEDKVRVGKSSSRRKDVEAQTLLLDPGSDLEVLRKHTAYASTMPVDSRRSLGRTARCASVCFILLFHLILVFLRDS